MLLSVLDLKPMLDQVRAKGYEVVNIKTTDGGTLPSGVHVGGTSSFQIAEETVAQQIKFNGWKPLNVLIEVIPATGKDVPAKWVDPFDILYG